MDVLALILEPLIGGNIPSVLIFRTEATVPEVLFRGGNFCDFWIDENLHGHFTKNLVSWIVGFGFNDENL